MTMRESRAPRESRISTYAQRERSRRRNDRKSILNDYKKRSRKPSNYGSIRAAACSELGAIQDPSRLSEAERLASDMTSLKINTK